MPMDKSIESFQLTESHSLNISICNYVSRLKRTHYALNRQKVVCVCMYTFVHMVVFESKAIKLVPVKVGFLCSVLGSLVGLKEKPL